MGSNKFTKLPHALSNVAIAMCCHSVSIDIHFKNKCLQASILCNYIAIVAIVAI